MAAEWIKKEYAAGTAIEHYLRLTCDHICGLVHNAHRNKFHGAMCAMNTVGPASFFVTNTLVTQCNKERLCRLYV